MLLMLRQPCLLVENTAPQSQLVNSRCPNFESRTNSPIPASQTWVNLRLQPDLPLILLQPKLAQPDPWHSAREHKHTRNNHSPMLNMRHIETIRRPGRRADRRKSQRCDHIPADPVVFVDAFGVVDAAVQAWRVVLRESDDGLDVEQDVECETEDGVRGREVLVP